MSPLENTRCQLNNKALGSQNPPFNSFKRKIAAPLVIHQLQNILKDWSNFPASPRSRDANRCLNWFCTPFKHNTVIFLFQNPSHSHSLIKPALSFSASDEATSTFKTHVLIYRLTLGCKLWIWWLDLHFYLYMNACAHIFCNCALVDYFVETHFMSIFHRKFIRLY